MSLDELVARLSDRESVRSEATIQADVRQLLLTAPLDLDEGDLVTLESPVGDRRRIDVEVGTTVIEVKKDLRPGKIRQDAIEQLSGYVKTRVAETGVRYVGVLTDGAEWRCYHLTSRGLEEVSAITVKRAQPDVGALLVWLEGVMATARDLPPTPREIHARLGADSSSHALDRASLTDLYDTYRSLPTVVTKRRLWARLLTTALGTQFEDDDDLFIEHTLLVNSAEIIAHAVLGIDVGFVSSAALLSGSKFDEAGIYGVVEADFFDWVVEVEGGDRFIRTMARRLARFEWGNVEHDVLKVLYESVIGPETRKKLGEYYTPDWLAEKVVETVVENPMEQRVLDPACGSGTFLFHAVRKYIRTGEAAGTPIADLLEGVTRHIMGMDLHPVAVTLARVTYLLAIGKHRLTDKSRRTIRVPVHLGDSLQWQQQAYDLFTHSHLVVRVDDLQELFASELRFPESLLTRARVFDQLVSELAAKASSRKPGDPVPVLSAVFQRLAIPPDAQPTTEATFRVMCTLHDEGRDHIWGYYVRNLARPVWLSRLENRVDVLVGNPPWLSFRFMTPEMQDTFKEMSEQRNLWHGAKQVTQQDLSGLFVVRSVQRYLKAGGKFGFVMPNAVVDREHFDGFRKGVYPDPGTTDPIQVQFDVPWDLRRVRPHIFPRGSGVAFGRRAKQATPMPDEVLEWSGRIKSGYSSWTDVSEFLDQQLSRISSITTPESEYKPRFTNGASIFPRLLFLAEERDAGPLGIPMGRVAVKSRRSAYENEPWKDIDDLEGVVESEFIRPVFLGESVLPFYALPPLRAVIPWEAGGLLDDSNDRLELHPGLAEWWHAAEQVWRSNSSGKLTLSGRLNYHNGLLRQFPIQQHRIVYVKSGMHLCAARLNDHRAVIDHTLYWATATTEDEATYLCAILNSAKMTELVRPLMSYGKDERHIDKFVWQLPIPLFDAQSEVHAALAEAGRQLEDEVGALGFDESKHFVALRRRIRKHIEESAVGQQVEGLVEKLLG